MFVFPGLQAIHTVRPHLRAALSSSGALLDACYEVETCSKGLAILEEHMELRSALRADLLPEEEPPFAHISRMFFCSAKVSMFECLQF